MSCCMSCTCPAACRAVLSFLVARAARQAWQHSTELELIAGGHRLPEIAWAPRAAHASAWTWPPSPCCSSRCRTTARCEAVLLLGFLLGEATLPLPAAEQLVLWLTRRVCRPATCSWTAWTSSGRTCAAPFTTTGGRPTRGSSSEAGCPGLQSGSCWRLCAPVLVTVGQRR